MEYSKQKSTKKICYFLDTDENASPFDINMAYDAGFDVVVPYNNMTADKVPKLVQDAIFSRKPNASTAFFIGGEDTKEADKITKKVLDSFVSPFECPVIVDPRGSHTTASAIIAKIIKTAQAHDINDLSGRKMVILGATGPVGEIGAIISARLKCNTIITSRRKQYIKDLARDLNKKAGDDASEIIGAVGITDDDKIQLLKDADIICSVAKAGIEMISKELLEKLQSKKIVVDINLVPPYGIYGLKPNYDNKEIYPGIFGIGALAIGNLKSKIEKSMLKEASNSRGKKIFNYKNAFDIAKKLLKIN
ncbi:MAG: hypothetical protein KGD63_01660 [Candidatus Lokiarchaeota archaeon]|nr:hypothetical protein [Candidatus Lokiarchaeota archaeon]